MRHETALISADARRDGILKSVGAVAGGDGATPIRLAPGAGGTETMSRLDREVNDALQRAQAEDLGRPRARFAREPEPLPDSQGWGRLSFLQPPTPWWPVGIGVLLLLAARFFGRAPAAGLLLYLGIALLVFGVLSLVLLRREQPKRWRGRLITLDDTWQARLYRRIYRR